MMDVSNHSDRFKIVGLKLRLIGKERQLLFGKPTLLELGAKPEDRTLFIVNMPPWFSDEAVVKKAFKDVGKVRSVTFDERVKGCGFNNAYVVFSKKESLDKALALSVIGPIDTPDDPLLLGAAKWLKEYHDNLRLGERIPEIVAEIRRKHALRKKILEKNERETAELEDQNGWTVVRTKARRPGISRKESGGKKLQIKKKMLWNYYKHDIKESKQNEIVELRKKFKLEKLRAAKIKEIRNCRRWEGIKTSCYY